MSRVYDNWERLVRATIRREELRISALRTPSDLSLASSSPSLSVSSSFHFIPPLNQVSSFISSHLSSFGDSFTYPQILQATHNLSGSNLIKNGRSGDFFYGVLEGETQVVVKKVDLSSVEKVAFLMSELEFFAKASHPRFVPLLGLCFENWGYKFLVYKYMANKDLSTFFYKKTDRDDVPSTPVDWKMRLKIAIGVAQALCHLHHQCVPPLVHRNVEASSLLIDENYDVHLGRLFEVRTEKKDRNQSRISRLLRLPKDSERDSSGASNATCADDVYCFGKILLELVTGNAISSYHHNSGATVQEGVLPYITTYNKELFLCIMDPDLMMDGGLLDEAWAVAVVAKACLNPKPSERPIMKNVLEALQHSRLKEFSTYVGFTFSGQLNAVDPALARTKIPEGPKVGKPQMATNATSSVFRISSAGAIEAAYPDGEAWDVPDLVVFSFAQLRVATRNFSYRSLGQGGFGRVYKGRLPEKLKLRSSRESLIAVKRWELDSLHGFVEWQTEVEMLGRFSHPNLVKLRGYCSEDEELLLVYEYMPKGSLNNHLYGRGSSIQLLSWGIRLKILIGAARGLAYLHALKREVLTDFRTSSILLDTAYNAKLTDFGLLARMGFPKNATLLPTYVMKTYEYAAPESIAKGRLTVKSDVYGFGVVMVEVLTGLPALDVNRSKAQHNLVDWMKPHLSNRQKIKLVMDSRLEDRYPVQAAVKTAQLALTCLSPEPNGRPSMKEVVEALERVQFIEGKQKIQGQEL